METHPPSRPRGTWNFRLLGIATVILSLGMSGLWMESTINESKRLGAAGSVSDVNETFVGTVVPYVLVLTFVVASGFIGIGYLFRMPRSRVPGMVLAALMALAGGFAACFGIALMMIAQDSIHRKEAGQVLGMAAALLGYGIWAWISLRSNAGKLYFYPRP